MAVLRSCYSGGLEAEHAGMLSTKLRPVFGTWPLSSAQLQALVPMGAGSVPLY